MYFLMSPSNSPIDEYSRETITDQIEGGRRTSVASDRGAEEFCMEFNLSIMEGINLVYWKRSLIFEDMLF